MLHWTLAVAVLLALVTHEGGRLHEAAGYAALGVAFARIALGIIGPPFGRFCLFVQGPPRTWSYARLLLRGNAPRYLNHNPLGAWMVMTLLARSSLGAASGWLYVTDRFWGEAWLIALHAALTWPIAVMVLMHVAGVAHASRRHGENLVGAMRHGRKRGSSSTSDHG